MRNKQHAPRGAYVRRNRVDVIGLITGNLTRCVSLTSAHELPRNALVVKEAIERIFVVAILILQPFGSPCSLPFACVGYRESESDGTGVHHCCGNFSMT